MPLDQDRYDVSIDLVTIAGTEYAMERNLAQYETWHSWKMTFSAFCQPVLLQRPKLQIVVRPCMVDGHSIWQFQADGRESYPKAIRVPANPREEIADRAFYAAPVLRHAEVAIGIQHAGFAAWQSCQQLQNCQAPTLS